MAKPQASTLADQYATYPTASAAAVAALRGITDKQAEYGGGVLYNKDQDVYAATQPVGQGDNAHFAAAVAVPPGWALHSTFHTHPSGDRSTLFSEGDISTAKRLKTPSYVLARDDDKIRMFDPASSKVWQDSSGGLSAQQRYSSGSLVKETPPTPQPAPQAPALATAPDPATSAPAAPVLVAGNRISMRNFAARHRAQTTKYRHKVVHIK
jgi:hypothetical protein